MAALSLAEAITLSFYAWETRGRGWMLADYPVALEPPFRPFFLLPEFVPERSVTIDDGKRPTFTSFLIDGARRLLSGSPRVAAPAPYEEEEPFPAMDAGLLTALRLLVPADFGLHAGVMPQLFDALGAAMYPVAFELIGASGKVAMQIICSTIDAPQVQAVIEGFLPNISVNEADDLLANHWDTGSQQRVVDFGLAHEFFLPITSQKAFRVDPYVALVPALAAAARGEFVALQVLIQRALNPWASAIHSAIDDGDGGCMIADAPWMQGAAKEKTDTELFAVQLRIAAQAESDDRAWQLLRGTEAFIRQYARPDGNALLPLANDGYDDDVHAASFLSRQTFRTGMLLSGEELSGLFHLPDESVRHPALLRAEVRSKELPNAARGSDLILGEHGHRGVVSIAGIDLESRFAHAWIVGASGTGKSTLLANLVLQDIRAGHGVAVLDPHGDLIDDICARIPEDRLRDVVLFDPADTEYPVGFNILGARSELERDLLASDLVAVFRRLATSWGDTMTTVLGNAVLAVLLHPKGGTLLQLRRFLIDERFRSEHLAVIRDPDIRFFWEKEYGLIGGKSIGPLLSRLDAFLRPRVIRNIVGQADAKLDLATVMESGQVFLAKLGKGVIGEENAALLGSLLVAKFNQLALARQRISVSERRAFFCYADEFQHFVTPSMESLATEGRKYRFGLVLAHQTLAQLADTPKVEGALLGNCHTRIVFRVGESDAKKLAEGFSFFEVRDVLGLSRGEAIARVGGASNDLNMKTYPLAQIDPEDAAKVRRKIVTRARERYAVTREELAARLGALCASAAVAGEERQSSEPKPSIAVSTPIAPPIASTETPTPPVLIPSIPRKIAPVPPAQTGRGGEQHKYLQHLIKRLAEERGFRAEIEGAAGDGQADVVLRRDDLVVGCEISVTTNVAHEAENLRKCIAAGFSRVLFVSPEKKQRDKVAAMIRAAMAGSPIDVIGPEDIVTALDTLGAAPMTTESVVRGYKVKVTRQDLSPADVASRRKAVAGVIARTMGK